MTFYLYIYAVLLLVGGFIGYKAGSKVSLYMGISSSILVLTGLYLANNNGVLGFGLTSAVCGVLIVAFAIRFVKTKKIMPAGMLLMLSGIALFASIQQLIG